MKKEGTGKPRSPDISFGADVKMRELHFEKVPETEVRFHGNTRRNSVSVTGRENLPDEVREGVVYRDAGVRLRIATEITGTNNSNPGFQISSDKGRVGTNWKYSEHGIQKQEPESREEKR